MSTPSHEGPTKPAAFCVRSGWFWAGSVLWILVVGSSLGVWLLREPRNGRAEGNANAAPVQSAEEQSAEPVVVKLPFNQSANGNSQVIDLSELMGQAKPDAEGPLWSPEGIEDFAFTNCDGQTITKADLLGRPWAICFVFTKCLGPCPTVTKQFRDLQSRLKNYDVKLVTLTVDPARDTPEVLAEYAKLNGADLNKWYFLTGNQDEIYGLIHRSFRMPVQEVTGPGRQEGFEVIHSTNVMLVDAEGVVRGKFNAAYDNEMVQLRKELQRLAVPLTTPSAETAETPLADGRN